MGGGIRTHRQDGYVFYVYGFGLLHLDHNTALFRLLVTLKHGTIRWHMYLPYHPRHRFQNAIRATGCARAEVAIGGVKAPIYHCGGRGQGERGGIESERL